MAGLLAQKSDRKKGDIIIFSKAVTSTNIDTAASALTSAASGGRLLCIGGLFATDATGLAGGTNIELQVNGETYGMAAPVVETVANLGASTTRYWGFGFSDDASNDRFVSDTAVPFVLENGDRVDIASTGADCTGAGVVLIILFFQRIDPQADISTT